MADSAVGDIVMSVLPIDTFRKAHGDTGPNWIWYPCEGENILNTPLGGSLPQNAPDFRGRYPRGYSSSPPNLGPGETGAPGTSISQTLQSHSHTFRQDIEGFDHGDGEHGPVWNPRPTNHQWQTDPTGSAETRPNSVVVYFYIRVR
jgi:hypothetical protein